MRSPDFSQRPTFHVASEYDKTYGPVATAIAAAVGVELDECQQSTINDWLAIDYRGAGLQINCVRCGESVLVPIPDGMKIDDLDIEPGEILKQLFAARRNLQRAEARIEELELEVRGVTMRRDTLRALLESFAIQLEELKELSRNEVKLRDKSAGLINRLAGDIESTIGDAAHGAMLDEDASDAE